VQTFVPYADFRLSAQALDTPRLGKQRVETLQILRALQFPEYGWANHPAVRMWRNRMPALVLYGLICAEEWIARGHADTTFEQIAEFAPEMRSLTQQDLTARGGMPSWVGNEELHESHRSRLMTKDPLYYADFAVETRPDLEYVWPEPDPGTSLEPGDTPAPGERLWVLRHQNNAVLGLFLDEGWTGLSAEPELVLDVTDMSLPELQSLVAPRRRRSKPLLALSRFVTDVPVGDRLALLIDGGRSLLTGTVTSPYRYRPSAPFGLCHQRAVSWREVLPRSSVTPPAALQDVRPVFDVRLDSTRWNGFGDSYSLVPTSPNGAVSSAPAGPQVVGDDFRTQSVEVR
jgi:hypothetical protein